MTNIAFAIVFFLLAVAFIRLERRTSGVNDKEGDLAVPGLYAILMFLVFASLGIGEIVGAIYRLFS